MSGLKTRAAVLRATNTPWEITEIDLRPPQTGEVLIRYMAAGLCHTDEHERTDTGRPLPFVGGHEGAGVVEAVGPGVSRVEVGDHVAVSYVPVCGTCNPCSTGHTNVCDEGRWIGMGSMPDGTYRYHENGTDVGSFCMVGTWSQRGVVSELSCVKIDKHIPFEVAALVGCGVPTGWGSSVYAGQVGAGDTVVIYGVGGVGMNAVQGARNAGAKTIVAVDPVAFKRESALKFGATHVLADANEAQELVRELTRGQMANVAICTVSLLDEATVNHAVQIIGKYGCVVLTSVGKPGENQVVIPSRGIPVGTGLIEYGRRIQGAIFGGANPRYDMPRLLSMYESGQLMLDELITTRYSLDEVNKGYEDLLAGKNIRGVIIHEHD